MIYESFEKTITSEKIERWRYPRFFSSDIGEDAAVVAGTDAHHISAVLRMKKGDLAIICDGSGTDRLCRLVSADRNAAVFDIIDERKNEAEPSVYVRLFQSLPKADKLDFIVQKAVELGVSEIIPVSSERSVSKPDEKAAAGKRERLIRKAEEAAKQCGRGIIPEVGAFVPFTQAVKLHSPDDAGMIFYECGGKSVRDILAGRKTGRVDIFVGPEGGYAPGEIALAQESGIVPATLGARILRCETAPVAALCLLMYLTGNM